MQEIECIKEFSGYLNRYEHHSRCCDCKMTFSVYLPAQSLHQKVPALYWLSGLTCSDDNARIKAGMQRYASEHGIALVFPDTSPRGEEVADEIDRYDVGQGAGFYVNATKAPWNKHYQMYDYVTQELPSLIESSLPIIANAKSISGHSMGGHGAIICGLKKTTHYRSVSAFAPICNPVESPWGKACLTTYLGDDPKAWQEYDATRLIESGATCNTILIDQGSADEFYESGHLQPESLQAACEKQDQSLTFRLQPGYDHSYHFVATFVGEHIAFHAKALFA